MKIGILGAGNIGGTLARVWSKKGHSVMLASKGTGASELAKEIGAEFGSSEEVAAFADVVVAAIPTKAFLELSETAKSGLTGKLVIDASNAYEQRDKEAHHLAIAEPDGTSAWVQKTLSGARVAKSFNTLYYKILEAGHGKGGKRLAIPVASDLESDRQTVAALIADLGFDALDAGPLAEGRFYQPETPAYSQEADVAELRALIEEGKASLAGHH